MPKMTMVECCVKNPKCDN